MSKKISFWVVFLMSIQYILFPCGTFAQDETQLLGISKKIIQAKSNDDLYAPFQEAEKFYLNDYKYNEFIDFLNSLLPKNKNLELFAKYYIGYARFAQLRYLEEKQLWEEYFSQGDKYKEELVSNLKSVIDSSGQIDPLNIKARFILWQYCREINTQGCSEDLQIIIEALSEYANSSNDKSLLLGIADTLVFLQEKQKAREIYRIYAGKIIKTDTGQENIIKLAEDFYNKQNIELAEAFYDVYIENIENPGNKTNTLVVLSDIAEKFSYKDKGISDPAYAERVFQKLQDLIGDDQFSEELIYKRAFNLERDKEYDKAKDQYLKLIKLYPESKYAEKVHYKIGLLYLYVSVDPEKAKEEFNKLIKQEKVSSYSIASLYQLGLLSQWELDQAKAKQYYTMLIDQAGASFQDISLMAQDRIKEIEDNKPLNYNIQTFMDVALHKKDFPGINMSKSSIKSSGYSIKKKETITVSSFVFSGNSGCLQPDVEFLWSAELGTTKPVSNQSAFETSYLYPGAKMIALVVSAPSLGIVSYNFDLIDVE